MNINAVFDKILSFKVKTQSEKVILIIAISSYLIHLLLILLTNFDILQLNSKLLKNPIVAIYTPFSFILVYEVYLLIFFLPKSISFYIGKQYEIITLIVIRRIFKDIGNLELTSRWFQSKSDLQFTYDALSSLILFTIIYYFYKHIKKRPTIQDKDQQKEIQKFINLKKTIAVLLVPTLLIVAIYTFTNWASGTLLNDTGKIATFKNINNVFFDEFFTILIVVDVLLLLASFFYSDKFHKIIRNSGFVISTILIKISFSTEGIINNALIIGAMLFGFFILLIHNKYEDDISSISDYK
ncbi:hypothetical protein BTO06_17425 [Tenacibaculum sp. SZ-18]|uniref:hypothetical protein n=1 Tax=Tenacibaculum sp. SZ-18 TaxID=754423 RepID=UPI000C2D5906|nr:hypothetical protein [Tenacibaculum sp. SZ-18]AUC16814.1 hypothetical protein BTO06_17425 [Tenacibaculum sp. SZ-18]